MTSQQAHTRLLELGLTRTHARGRTSYSGVIRPGDEYKRLPGIRHVAWQMRWPITLMRPTKGLTTVTVRCLDASQ